MVGRLQEGLDFAGLRLVACLMWMDAGAEPDIVIRLGDGAWTVNGAQLHTDRDDPVYAGLSRPRQDARQIARELRIIKMRMAVDDHIAHPSPSSTT